MTIDSTATISVTTASAFAAATADIEISAIITAMGMSEIMAAATTAVAALASAGYPSSSAISVRRDVVMLIANGNTLVAATGDHATTTALGKAGF